jgi:hypothetical protein
LIHFEGWIQGGSTAGARQPDAKRDTGLLAHANNHLAFEHSVPLSGKSFNGVTSMKRFPDAPAGARPSGRSCSPLFCTPCRPWLDRTRRPLASPASHPAARFAAQGGRCRDAEMTLRRNIPSSWYGIGVAMRHPKRTFWFPFFRGVPDSVWIIPRFSRKRGGTDRIPPVKRRPRKPHGSRHSGLVPLAVRDGVQSSGGPLGSGAPSRDSGTHSPGSPRFVSVAAARYVPAVKIEQRLCICRGYTPIYRP